MMTIPCLIAAAAPAGDGIIQTFGLDAKVIVAQAINFVVVAFLLWKFAYKPVIATLDERQQKIAEGLRFAEEARARLESASREQQQTLRNANIEAQRVLQEANRQAQAFEEKMRTETTAQLDEMRRRANDANELERLRILGEVRQEIARLVVLTSGKVLQAELTDAERSRLTAAAAREVASLN
jgi:F-type H+-transporting ATPase subunit b